MQPKFKAFVQEARLKHSGVGDYGERLRAVTFLSVLFGGSVSGGGKLLIALSVATC